ncbi:transposase [Bacillus sp. KH172YL63]|uniref:transposase n=1 Tax=Bacillus sp. KH172YL63 TaxID=2709784 RepID=UPI0015645C46|nr:transposase [Bacillus sp. KH172YL63]
MPRQARTQSKTGVYHVIVRGVNKQEIFHDDHDRIKYLDLLKRYKSQSGFRMYAWCLMGNHVHLLLKEESEGISLVMKRVGVSYAFYYHSKYRTAGHLFQDRFKSERVENQKYFLTVARYIHQNPIKAGIVSLPHEWKWSSCLGYYGQTVYPPTLLDPNYLLSMFSPHLPIARTEFKQFNERNANDQCLDESSVIRLTDDEARVEIIKHIGSYQIPQVKSLPREERMTILKNIKTIPGLSQRQAARILGVSPSLVFKV